MITDNKTVNNVRTALMAVLIAVCAWISIPTEIPFTLQTFGVFLTLRLLKGKHGSLSVLIYILLGLIGAPVFANFSSGAGILLGPTGGYIIGFLFTGLIYWALERFIKNDYTESLVLAAGLAVCYLFGTIWFSHVMSAKGNDFTFIQSLMICVVPYLIPDLLKLALSQILAKQIVSIIVRADHKEKA